MLYADLLPTIPHLSHNITAITYGCKRGTFVMGFYCVTTTHPNGLRSRYYYGLDEIVWC